MSQQNQVDSTKQAARRLSAFLARHGIRLKHNLALEAIAVGVGDANWRTLRARAQPPAPGSLGYQVHAIYTDNDQRYSDTFGGANALEAQLNALTDRYADSGCDIRIAAVVDLATGEVADEESCATEVELVSLAALVDGVALMAQDVMCPDAAGRAVGELSAMAGYLRRVSETVDLGDVTLWATDEVDATATCTASDELGREVSFRPVDALSRLAAFVRDQPGFAARDTAQRSLVYQALAFCTRFEAELNSALVDN